jgi:uncharacterized protein (DUF4415 family)
MKNTLSIIDDKGEIRELTTSNMALFKPAEQVLPADLMKKLTRRGPNKKPTKERISIRYSPDVLSAFRVTGKGWQTRIDEALKDWLKSHTLS